MTVRVEGAGTLLGFGSAAPSIEERFTDEERTTYYGRALAVRRAKQRLRYKPLVMQACFNRRGTIFSPSCKGQ